MDALVAYLVSTHNWKLHLKERDGQDDVYFATACIGGYFFVSSHHDGLLRLGRGKDNFAAIEDYGRQALAESVVLRSKHNDPNKHIEAAPRLFSITTIAALAAQACDPEAERAVHAVIDNPDAKIRIYRVMPTSGVTFREHGEFVSLGWTFAQRFANGRPDVHVVTVAVPAGAIFFDDPHVPECGYQGPRVAGDVCTRGPNSTPYTGQDIGRGDWFAIDDDGGNLCWFRAFEVGPTSVSHMARGRRYEVALTRVTNVEKAVTRG